MLNKKLNGPDIHLIRHDSARGGPEKGNRIPIKTKHHNSQGPTAAIGSRIRGELSCGGELWTVIIYGAVARICPAKSTSIQLLGYQNSHRRAPPDIAASNPHIKPQFAP